jgi:hypothetical protein
MKYKMKYKLRRMKKIMIKPYYMVKYAYQRVTRGFSDQDMFNADQYFAGQFAGMLRWYVKNSSGVPMHYAKKDDPYGTDIEYMQAKRDKKYLKYAALFEEYNKNGNAIGEKWKRMFGGLTDDEVRDIMTWFGKHFTEFWD